MGDAEFASSSQAPGGRHGGPQVQTDALPVLPGGAQLLNRCHKPRGLKQQDSLLPQVQEQSSKSRAQKGWFLQEAPRGNLPRFSSGFRGPRSPSAHRRLPPVSTSTITRPSCPCSVCVHTLALPGQGHRTAGPRHSNRTSSSLRPICKDTLSKKVTLLVLGGDVGTPFTPGQGPKPSWVPCLSACLSRPHTAFPLWPVVVFPCGVGFQGVCVCAFKAQSQLSEGRRGSRSRLPLSQPASAKCAAFPWGDLV